MHVGVVTASVATTSIQRGKVEHIKAILQLKVQHDVIFNTV